jgi:hypothetical protein
MRKDFITFKRYYRDTAFKVPEDSFYHQTLNHKFKHSVEVLHIGQTILNNTPELKNATENFKKAAEIALLFHDVGRFEEAVHLYEVEQNNGDLVAAYKAQNHGIIGYDLLKNDENYNDMRVLFAVRWHGHMPEEIRCSEMYQVAKNSPQFTEITEILRLVRDADKLANLYVIKKQDHLRKDLFFQQLSPDELCAPISEKVMAQFLAGQVILTATIHSFADRIMQVISWIYDYNYTATKMIFKAHDFGDYLLRELSKYHHNEADIAEIRAALVRQMQF